MHMLYKILSTLKRVPSGPASVRNIAILFANDVIILSKMAVCRVCGASMPRRGREDRYQLSMTLLHVKRKNEMGKPGYM